MNLLINLGQKIINFFFSVKTFRHIYYPDDRVTLTIEDDGVNFSLNYDDISWPVVNGVVNGLLCIAAEDWAPGIWAGTDNTMLVLTKMNTPYHDFRIVHINFVDLNHRKIYLHDAITLDGWWEIKPYRGPDSY